MRWMFGGAEEEEGRRVRHREGHRALLIEAEPLMMVLNILTPQVTIDKDDGAHTEEEEEEEHTTTEGKKEVFSAVLLFPLPALYRRADTLRLFRLLLDARE